MHVRSLGRMAVFLSVTACRSKATPPAPTAPGSVASAPVSVVPLAGLPSAAPKATACRPLRAAPLPRFMMGSLTNVRVAASAAGALVTWQEHDDPEIGDSSQVGQAVFLTPSVADAGADTETHVVVPARAYAAAAYTNVAPTSFAGELSILGYGVAGATSFMSFPGGPKPWSRKPNTNPFDAEPPAPAHKVSLPFSFMEPLVASSSMPLAVLGGGEAPCASHYDCPAYAAALDKGFPRSVRSLFLRDKAHVSEVLYKGTPSTPKKPFVPAVAARANGERALTIFRVDKKLEAVWFGADGKKTTSFSLWEGIDVGAPAVTFVGEEAFGAWVVRDGAKQPYKMYIAHIADKAADVVREVDLGDESVMAPALADLGDKLAIAWMSGDDGAKGRVHLGTVAASAIMSGKDKLHLAEDVWTSDPGNHRDPEIATGGGRLYFVWSDFTTKKKEGVLMLREFGCP